jgi:hypothetical protein
MILNRGWFCGSEGHFGLRIGSGRAGVQTWSFLFDFGLFESFCAGGHAFTALLVVLIDGTDAPASVALKILACICRRFEDGAQYFVVQA